MSSSVDFAEGFRGKYITQITRFEFDGTGVTEQMLPGNSFRYSVFFQSPNTTTWFYPQEFETTGTQFPVDAESGTLFKESDQPGLPAYPWFGNDDMAGDILTIIETILIPKGGGSSAGKTFRSQDELTQQKRQSRLESPRLVSSRMQTLARRLSSGRR